MRILVLLLLLLFTQSQSHARQPPAPADAAPIAYHLTVPESGTAFHVTVTVDKPQGAQTDFAIPAWSPGYYQILDFEKGIGHVTATDENHRALAVTHPSRRAWRVLTLTCVQSLTLSYDVSPQEPGLGFFGTSFNRAGQQAYINGAAAFLYVTGQTAQPVTLDVTLPALWKVASPLTPVPAGDTNSDTNAAIPANAAIPVTTHWQAADYDEMIDAPLQMGRFDSVDFTVENIAFQAIIVGSGSVNKARLAVSLCKITRAAIPIFGAAPFRRYTFFYHIGGGGFLGGLEHRNSTIIHLWNAIGDASSDGFLSTTAHEFFHAWNVKRLRPSGLGPFDYTRPVRTASLWWAEGVTDYYAQRLLVLSGLRDGAWFLDDIAARLQELAATPARAHVSLEKASRNAWEGGSMGFDGLSYYLKGSLVGFYFDLRIRALTSSQKTLDDVMRLLDAQYGAKNVGYPEDALLKALNAAADYDFSAEYARYVRGTDEIDWTPVLQQSGLELEHLFHTDKSGVKSETYQLHPLPDEQTSDAEQKIRNSLLNVGGSR